MNVLLMMRFITGCHTGTLSFETSLANCHTCYNIFNIFVPSHVYLQIPYLLYILFCTLGLSGIVVHIFTYFTFI